MGLAHSNIKPRRNWVGSALFIRQSTHGCGDIVVCGLLETREDTVGRHEARCCGAVSRHADIGDFLVKETVEIPGADVVATL